MASRERGRALVGRSVVDEQLGGPDDHADFGLLPALGGQPAERDEQRAAQAKRQREVNSPLPPGQRGYRR